MKKGEKSLHFTVIPGESTLSRSFGHAFNSLTFARHVGLLYARRCRSVDKKKSKRSQKVFNHAYFVFTHLLPSASWQSHNSEVPDTNRSKIGVDTLLVD